MLRNTVSKQDGIVEHATETSDACMDLLLSTISSFRSILMHCGCIFLKFDVGLSTLLHSVASTKFVILMESVFDKSLM